MKYKRADGKTVRPSLVVLDDPQTDESARSLSQPFAGSGGVGGDDPAGEIGRTVTGCALAAGVGWFWAVLLGIGATLIVRQFTRRKRK